METTKRPTTACLKMPEHTESDEKVGMEQNGLSIEEIVPDTTPTEPSAETEEPRTELEKYTTATASETTEIRNKESQGTDGNDVVYCGQADTDAGLLIANPDTALTQIVEGLEEPEETETDDFLGSLLKDTDGKLGTESRSSLNTKEVDGKNELSSESSSDGDDSSDESDSDSEEEEAEADDDQDVREDEENSDNEQDTATPVTSKNEVSDEPAHQLPEGFTIDKADPIQHIGHIIGFVDKSIIIKSNTSGEFRFLKEGSVVCFEDKTPIGYLFEIFGPVAKPIYRVKFNKEEDIQKFKSKKNEKVFYVVPSSNFEYTDTIKAIKGSDASNWNDEEVQEEEQDFSDDEKEMESKKLKKQSKKNKNSRNAAKRPTAEGDDQSMDVSAQQKKRHHPPQQKSNNYSQGYRQPQHTESPRTSGYQSRSQREQQTSYRGQQQFSQGAPGSFPMTPSFQAPHMIGTPMMHGMPIMPGMPMLPGMPMVPGMSAFRMAPVTPQFPMMQPPPPGTQPHNPIQMQQMMQMMMMQQFMNNQQNLQPPPPPPPQ